MKIILEDGNASEIYYNGKYYKTRKEIEVSLSEGLRLQRTFRMKILNPEKGVYDPSIFYLKKEVAMVADIDTISGWGNVGLNLIKYSSVEVDTVLIGKLARVDESTVVAAANREVLSSMGVVIHEQPKEEWLNFPFRCKIAVVPFETTRVPQSWVHRINACTAIIVPCKQNVEMMRDSGVNIPIEIVHWGVDPDRFYKIDRPKRDIFTFGIMGSLTKRKGIDILVDAFLKAFPNEKDVRLLCKTSNSFFLWAVKDKRLVIDMTPVSHEELMGQFFQQIDCFVWPSHGEGFGLPPLEAMATGVPVIATGWSGMEDYMTPEVGWKINYTMEEAVDFNKNVYKEDCGNWAKPDSKHLIELMRYAYEHREEVKKKGDYAAEYVKNEWTWDKKINMYLDVLKKYL